MYLFQEANWPISSKYFDLVLTLSHFGLNPADWRLIPDSKNVFHIQNKEEPSFRFKGECNFIKGRIHWDKIVLLSL